MYYMDWTWLIVIPGMLLALIAQHLVRSTYTKYSQEPAQNGMTAAQVARQMLNTNGAADVQIERIAGELTDNYDPRDKTLRLSAGVYDSTSIAALGIAAHETGHALQHQQDYAPLQLRSYIVPAVNITSQAAFPLFMAGMLFSWEPLITIGILCFAVAVVFSLITLPVEFNASNRAIAALEGGGYLTRDENEGAKKVLRAAALTYVASALTAILQLVRLLMISNSRRRD